MAKRLGRCSAKTVGRLLKGMDYSLRTNVKRLAGKPHPHRDRQYRFIQRVKSLYRRHGTPVISVDAKKNELIGNFKNAGEVWCVDPEEVNMYDFPSDSEGRATPYGIFDQATNHAFVMIGISVITAAFAVASIRRRFPRPLNSMKILAVFSIFTLGKKGFGENSFTPFSRSEVVLGLFRGVLVWGLEGCLH